MKGLGILSDVIASFKDLPLSVCQSVTLSDFHSAAPSPLWCQEVIYFERNSQKLYNFDSKSFDPNNAFPVSDHARCISQILPDGVIALCAAGAEPHFSKSPLDDCLTEEMKILIREQLPL